MSNVGIVYDAATKEIRRIIVGFNPAAHPFQRGEQGLILADNAAVFNGSVPDLYACQRALREEGIL